MDAGHGFLQVRVDRLPIRVLLSWSEQATEVLKIILGNTICKISWHFKVRGRFSINKIYAELVSSNSASLVSLGIYAVLISAQCLLANI